MLERNVHGVIQETLAGEQSVASARTTKAEVPSPGVSLLLACLVHERYDLTLLRRKMMMTIMIMSHREDSVRKGLPKTSAQSNLPAILMPQSPSNSLRFNSYGAVHPNTRTQK